MARGNEKRERREEGEWMDKEGRGGTCSTNKNRSRAPETKLLGASVRVFVLRCIVAEVWSDSMTSERECLKMTPRNRIITILYLRDPASGLNSFIYVCSGLLFGPPCS